jgi:hypothetical protein
LPNLACEPQTLRTYGIGGRCDAIRIRLGLGDPAGRLEGVASIHALAGENRLGFVTSVVAGYEYDLDEVIAAFKGKRLRR